MTATVFATFTPPPYPAASVWEIGGPEAEPQTELQTARDTLLQIVPRWLRGKLGGGLLHTIGAQIDALTDALRDGVRARLPGYSPDAVTMLSRDRRLRQGLHETADHLAARLPGWWVKHAIRGGPYALLEQVYEYFAPQTFQVELRYASGRRFRMDTDGVITRDVISWTPPAPPEQWARWWLIYSWPSVVRSDGIWSDPGTWNDGGVWDSDISAAEVRSVRLIPREWNAAHSIGYVTLDSSAVGGIVITFSVEAA